MKRKALGEMQGKAWRKYIIWILPVVAAFAWVMLPQAAFAVEAEEPVAMEEPERPVGGWEPAELIYVPEDVDIADVPSAKKGARKAIKGDSDSVFAKSASTIGYDALDSDAQRTYYQQIDAAAVAFMNAETDLTITDLGEMELYVFAPLNYAKLGLTKDEAMEAFFAYDYDHPAYYWLNSSSLPYSTTTLYICTEEEYASVSARQEVSAMVIAGVKSYANLAGQGTDTLDEIALVHDKIVNDIDYAYSDGGAPESAKWAHGVHGVFDPNHRQAVCEGYADAFAMVMNYL